jgi:hypothetical protein
MNENVFGKGGSRLIDVPFLRMPGGTEKNHEKPQQKYLVSRPIFEPRVSRTRGKSLTAVLTCSVCYYRMSTAPLRLRHTLRRKLY